MQVRLLGFNHLLDALPPCYGIWKEAYGSYNAWAVRHRSLICSHDVSENQQRLLPQVYVVIVGVRPGSHPLVRRFSWDLGDPEPRLRLAVLRVWQPSAQVGIWNVFLFGL